MHIASGSALEMLISMFVLFCTWPVICFAGHVPVFVLCEHFCLIAMCSRVYCLDPAHLVTSLLVQLPHLLSLITLLICSLFILLVSCASSLSYLPWLCSDPALPCPALPCPFLPSLSNCQLSFFPPQGSFFFGGGGLFLLLKYHLLHYWVLASSRTPDSYENVRLRCSCNFHITDKKNSANIKKPGRFESLHNIKNNIVIRSIQYQRECLSYVCIISKKKYHNIKYGCFKHRGNI